MTVTVDKDIRRMYTWRDAEDAAWQWNSPSCRIKPWKEFGLIYFTADAAEVSFSISNQDNRFEFFKSLSETLSVFDGISKSVSKTTSYHSFGIQDSKPVFDLSQKLFESLTFTDQASMDYRMLKASAFGVDSDGIEKAYSQKLRETVSFLEEHKETLIFNRDFSSSFGIDTLDRIVGFRKVHTEDSLSLTDSHPIFEIEKGLWEEFFIRGMPPLITNEFIRRFRANFIMGDWMVNDIDKTMRESFKATELLIPKGILHLERQSFDIQSALSSIITFNRLFESSISIDEAVKKTVEMPFEDRFQIASELIKGGGVTVSDLRFMTVALSDADFDELFTQASPAGYKAFTPFLTGDYEYNEALLKVVMQTKNTSRPCIEQLRIEVDLPDLFDKGSNDIPASLTRIDFKKKFYMPPELSVAVSGGATSFIPRVEIVDIKKNYFEVELRNPETSTPVAGKINWKAQGI
ncbi:hypothetical protein ABXV18_24345 [Vibrio owensii]|uniref:hypothetical protein n=1 Tax=Vibrio owensii TaxID=696485 RepID=UPI003394985E